MSEAAILWLFGTVIAVLTAIISGMAGWIFVHSRDCRDFRVNTAASLASILTKLDRVQNDIGDHNSGLRGQVHKLSSDITPYIVMAQMDMMKK
jgi:hypothetical protein